MCIKLKIPTRVLAILVKQLVDALDYDVTSQRELDKQLQTLLIGRNDVLPRLPTQLIEDYDMLFTRETADKLREKIPSEKLRFDQLPQCCYRRPCICKGFDDRLHCAVTFWVASTPSNAFWLDPSFEVLTPRGFIAYDSDKPSSVTTKKQFPYRVKESEFEPDLTIRIDMELYSDHNLTLPLAESPSMYLYHVLN